jgi:hypothetical protein
VAQLAKELQIFLENKEVYCHEQNRGASREGQIGANCCKLVQLVPICAIGAIRHMRICYL